MAIRQRKMVSETEGSTEGGLKIEVISSSQLLSTIY